MENAYQNSTISQILEAILEQTTFTGTSNSNIADILLSILYNTPYVEEPKSVLAELFLKLKAKIENEPFEPYDKEPKSVLAEILLSILNETEYTKPATSRIGELLLQLKEELEKYAEVTVSGAICNFNTSLVKPLVNLKAYFEATQEAGTPTPQSPKAISGVSAVNVIHCGVNLWNEAWEVGGISNTTGDNIPSTAYYRSRDYISVVPASRIYISKPNANTLGLRLYDKNKNYLSSYAYSTNSSIAIPSNCYYLRFVNISTNVYNNDISVNYPATDTEYHAYNPNSNVVTIALGGTYYGGYVEQDKDGHRKLVNNTFTFVCNNDLSITIFDIGAENVIFRIPFSDNNFAVGIADTVKSTHFSMDIPSGNGRITNTSERITCVIDKSLLDTVNVNGIKKWLTDNNVFFMYETATPREIDLPDGEPIITFNGDNNIYNDSANTEVTYLTTINDNINRAVTVKRQQDRLKELEKEALKPKDEVIVEEPKPIEKELKK